MNISASSQYNQYLTDFLLDSNENEGWNSGSFGESWLKYNFEHPVYLDSIIYSFNVDSGAKSEHKVYFKTKGSADSTMLYYSNYISGKDKIVLNVKKDDIYEVVFLFKTETSWIELKSVKMNGKYKNWLNLWEK